MKIPRTVFTWSAAAAFAVLAAARARADSAARVLTLEQAVQQAFAHNPLLRGRRAASGADQEQARAQRGRLLPWLGVNALYYDINSPEQANVGGLLASSGSGSTSLPIRNAGMGLGLVTVSQPLLGLLHGSYEYASAAEFAEASEEDLRALESKLREQVQSNYLDLFEARTVGGIARASFEQLGEQLRVMRAKFEDGAATRADVMRLSVAVANGEQEAVQAEVREHVARAALLSLIGLPPGRADVDFAEPDEGLELPSLPEAADAEAFALEHRAEIRAATKRQDAAHDSRLGAEFKLLPELSATAAYVRLQGFSSAIPADFFALGLTFDWKIWDWGATYYASRAALQHEAEAGAAVDGARAQVILEVTQRAAEERAASHAVRVAKEAIEQAEEAYRVTAEMMAAGAATTTDFLDAQSGLTRAKLNLARARYEAQRARFALRTALGA